MHHASIPFAIVLLAVVTFAPAAETDWPAVTQVNKPWARWWWLGSAVDQKNLTREMEQMQATGIGGVEVTPIYGATGYEDRYIDFLSPKWIQMLHHVADEGKRLNMGVDMATGTGWPFGGGPLITLELADTKVDRVNGKLVGVPTQMKVKRSAPGDEGWVLDPYSVKAIQTYLGWFNAPMSGIPKGMIRDQFHDSFEYMGNWTADLPARFKAMHGYDLNDHAGELFGEGNPDTVGRVKSDYRETLAKLHEEYHDYWVKWCHDHGWLAREQAHGAPANLLDLYGDADVPETETFGSTPFTIPGFRRDASEIASNGNGPNPLVMRFATSAAHVMGRQLASSETLTWLREHFHVALSMAKPEVDQLFVNGINHILYHGTCYSPDDVAWPGWLFYASSEVNPRDTLWKTLPQLNAYIARCQSILQSGTPDNDVLVYYPFFDHIGKADGMDIRFAVNIKPPWLVGTEIEKTLQKLSDSGFSYDMISDRQLQETKNDGNQLVVPGGKYRVLLVPKTAHMPVETMKKLIELADGGATVVFADELPSDVPGLANLDARRAEMTQLRSRLGVISGKGKVVIAADISAALLAAGAKHEAMTDQGIAFIRRTTPQGHDYFAAALQSKGINGWTPLTVAAKSAVLMDPLTGKTGVAAVRQGSNGAEIYLQLEPGESIIIRTFANIAASGPAWTYLQTTGQPVELTGTWTVDFLDGGPEKPKSFQTAKLDSWTTLGDDNAKRFAGTARYQLSFGAPAGFNGQAILDLGDVREAAVVYLNGRQIGNAWSLPFKIPVEELREVGNVLEIEVTNLSANRIRDLDIRGVKWRIFREINYVNINYTPLDATGWAIMPSGLLGPIRLIPTSNLSPK